MLELRKMKGERRWCDPQGIGDPARRHSLGAGLHQQSKDFEPVFLGKCRRAGTTSFAFIFRELSNCESLVKRRTGRPHAIWPREAERSMRTGSRNVIAQHATSIAAEPSRQAVMPPS